jgi:hypothetical protein
MMSRQSGFCCLRNCCLSVRIVDTSHLKMLRKTREYNVVCFAIQISFRDTGLRWHKCFCDVYASFSGNPCCVQPSTLTDDKNMKCMRNVMWSDHRISICSGDISRSKNIRWKRSQYFSQNLEDHPDHHEEIKMLTLDILTFYIWDRFFYRELWWFYNFYIYIQFDNMY